jgi:hypothetical protein
VSREIEVFCAVKAQKKKGLLREEIVKLSKIPDGGGLSVILEELEQCGFISFNNAYNFWRKT